ncbi:MAG: homoserine dehydrogenase, partial [Nitrospinaceae bacterium]|nr:homoserine dehydrogenase [Nitrospinaceae bacterium]NIS87160.1 homoserine dehydrogenase [Nitrospinaceae bacterium]NIT84027.1 homoserine dehydrogenase [Nitrospinaceae bacterium]NIU46211.1 homoserine dehydrogenase [Nitrospinaceae bacterium]NIU98388.1 homoserine dehydrogenase [Nitrospinaceae bacterium]
IESVIQRSPGPHERGVPLVMMVHRANERNTQAALKEIDQLDVVCDKSNLIRVEK